MNKTKSKTESVNKYVQFGIIPKVDKDVISVQKKLVLMKEVLL